MRNVTVLGGGIVGLCCALHLQREGFSVTLVDRDEPGAGCSHGNAGMIQTGSVLPLALPGILRRLPGMLLDPVSPLAMRPASLPRLAPWLLSFLRSARPGTVARTGEALASILSRAKDAYMPLIQASGAGSLLVDRGELYVTREAGASGLVAFKLDAYRRHGIEALVLDEAALHEMEPALAPDYRTGYYLPDSRYVLSPRRLSAFFAEAFAARGGTVLRRTVRGLEVADGGVTALVTEDGPLPVERLVVAAGAFSAPFAAALGSPVLLAGLRGYHLMVEPGDLVLNGPMIDLDRSFAITPMADGLRLAGTAELADLDAAPNWRRATILLDHARSTLPGLKAETGLHWMGHRPATPDSLPVIGPAPRARNAWLAFGHGQLGLTLAAVTGELVAESVAGRPPSVDLSPFSPTRPAIARGRSAGTAAPARAAA